MDIGRCLLSRSQPKMFAPAGKRQCLKSRNRVE
jgi:hypothetical protein